MHYMAILEAKVESYMSLAKYSSCMNDSIESTIRSFGIFCGLPPDVDGSPKLECFN